MSALSTILAICADLCIIVGWVWSLRRAWSAPNDPDLELAIELARVRSKPNTQQFRGIDVSLNAIDWKHRLETRSSLPALGSAVLSGVYLGFSGNALDRSSSFIDTWILSMAALVISVSIVLGARLLTAKRIEHRLPRLAHP